MPRFISQSRVMICLLMLFIPAFQLSTSGHAGAQPLTGPFLSITAPPIVLDGLMSINARGFTDGDFALLTISTTQNQSATSLISVASSASNFGVNGSVDPAQGYVKGGSSTFLVAQRTIESTEPVVGPLHQSGYQPMLVEIGWPAVDVDGPNGSADPAWGGSGERTVTVACGATVTLHAYDVASASMSNDIALTPPC